MKKFYKSNRLKYYILILTTIISWAIPQNEGYIWPTDASKTVTAFFGEMRPNRYHTGIDIRTFGVNGKEIYAIDDGYVYRIGISNNKYGNVLYIKLKDENIAVYSHLDRFNPIIQKVAHQIQNQQNSYSIDYFLEAGLINVSKGDIIGYTGDTGGLSGPHLHFEIRDKINQPINPFNTNLKDFFIDNIAPIPQSIAFIPKSDSTKINGTYFAKNFELVKKDNNNYFLKDTLNIIGDFGVALQIIDKVNGQPFKYGIYSLELFIDSLRTYKINFDFTSFEQPNQLYLERDYELYSTKNEEYYRLFKSEFQNNYFVDNNSMEKIHTDSGLHSFKIIAKDIRQNETLISGFFINQNTFEPKYDYYQLKNGKWKIDFQNIDNIQSFKSALFSDKNNIQDQIESNHIVVSDSSLIISNSNNTYNVLEFTLQSSNFKSSKKFILLDEEPKDIKGDFFINHNNQGLTVNFIEQEFSNKLPYLVYSKNNMPHKELMKRNKKNVLTSSLFKAKEFVNVKDIRVEYDSDYIISKKLDFESMLTSPDFFNQKTFKNGQISISHDKETFYDTTVVYITHPPIKNFNNQSIIAPFYIGPSSIPFNKPLNASLFLPSQIDLSHMLVCSYDRMKNKWIPLKTDIDLLNNNLETELKSGAIIGVIEDNQQPKIRNIIPRNNATYLAEDLGSFNIELTDDFSGVNYDSGIQLTLNDKIILTGFNVFQKKIIANVKGEIKSGENKYKLIVYDNANNKNKIEGSFFVKEDKE